MERPQGTSQPQGPGQAGRHGGLRVGDEAPRRPQGRERVRRVGAVFPANGRKPRGTRRQPVGEPRPRPAHLPARCPSL